MVRNIVKTGRKGDGVKLFSEIVAGQIANLLNSQNQLTVPYKASKILEDEERYIVRTNDKDRVIGAVEVKLVQWYQCEIDHLGSILYRGGRESEAGWCSKLK